MPILLFLNIIAALDQPKPPDRFPNVFYAKYQVWQLTPKGMDKMLANGWQRQDRHVTTTIGRLVDRQWKPIVMVRIAVKDLVWKKKLRKRLRTNSSLFEYTIRPFVARNELDQLWYNYKTKIHGWKRVVPLAEHLFRGLPAEEFNTYELTVHHKEKLVAFSIFDRGEKSLASIEAAYDVNFKKYSLGIFTMLLEIEYCKKKQIEYYYPGFYPKDSPMFDYKLRPGNVEFFDKKQSRWRDWGSFEEKDWLFLEVLSKLQFFQSHIKDTYTCTLKAFNHFAYPDQKPSALSYNFLLELRKPANPFTNAPYKVSWDPIKERYLLFYENNVPTYESNAKIIHPFTPMAFAGHFENATVLTNTIRKLTVGI